MHSSFGCSRVCLPGQADALAKFLETDSTIDYAEPDLLRQPALVPNDTYYSADQWDLQSPPAEPGSVDLPAAWDLTTGSSSIVVGVIDTGILPHPDLIGRYLAGYDMIVDPMVANDQDPASCTVPGTCSSRDGNPTDPGDWVTSTESASGYFQGCPATNSSFHGTHVSGTIGAASNNGTGVAGINWTSKILPVRVLGKCGGYISDIADAIVWASGGSVPGVPANPNPARVLNLSLGGTGPCDTASQNAINSALAAGTVVVVAAGNSNSDASGFTPANCSGVITVAATGRQGQRASYSNYGATVEISAPGGSDGQAILSTLNNGTTSPNPSGYDYVYYMGTSMATPHVTGIASLMLSLAPSLTPAQVLATIQSTARAFPTGTVRDCTTALCGSGIVDAAAALRSLVSAAASTTSLSSSLNPSTVGTPVTLTATVTGTSPTGSVSLADGGSALSGCTGLALSGSGNTRTAACTTSSLATGTHSLVASYSGDAANAPSSSTTLAQVVNGATTTATASFVGTDTTTQGNWKGVYGSDGYNVIGDTTSYPAYAQVTAAGATAYVWASQSTDPRALLRGVTTGRIAATWYSATSFTVDVNLTDGNPHRVALYNLDWDTTARAQRIDILDASSGSVLDSRSVTNFHGGQYLVWTLSGHVTIRITMTAGYNAVLSGLFFDAPASTLPATTTTLASSLNPATVGTPVTLTASVTGTNPTGSVSLADGGSALSGCTSLALSGSGNTRTAACTTSSLAAGTHSLVASYSGDAANAPSSSTTLAQVVNGAGRQLRRHRHDDAGQLERRLRQRRLQRHR